MTQEDAPSGAAPSLAGGPHLDDAEMVVYARLRHLGCTVCADPSDPEDCASVAEAAVAALRKAGMLKGAPGVTQEDAASAAEVSLSGAHQHKVSVISSDGQAEWEICSCGLVRPVYDVEARQKLDGDWALPARAASASFR